MEKLRSKGDSAINDNGRSLSQSGVVLDLGELSLSAGKRR
jgi:hypothetical protein